MIFKTPAAGGGAGTASVGAHSLGRDAGGGEVDADLAGALRFAAMDTGTYWRYTGVLYSMEEQKAQLIGAEGKKANREKEQCRERIERAR